MKDLLGQISGHLFRVQIELDFLHKHTRGLQKDYGTTDALYTRFQNLTQCVVIGSRHINYCKTFEHKVCCCSL